MEKEVIGELGLDLFDYEKFEYEQFQGEMFEFKTFEYERFEYEQIGIRILRRGVIGVNAIGYV